MESAKESIEKNDLDQLFRAAHTIKGNARIYSLSGLSAEVHSIENDIDNLRQSSEANNQNEEKLGAIFNSLKNQLMST